MSSAIVWVVLSGAMSPAQSGELEAMTEYTRARDAAKRSKQRLAVVFVPGSGDWRDVVVGGTVDAATSQLLRRAYVTLYVDTTSAEGQRLASAFGLRGNRGLVLSDRAVDRQEYHHVGRVSGLELTGQLRKHLGYVQAPAPRIPATNVFNSLQGGGIAPACRT